MDNFLSREQIAEIVAHMTARDIFGAMPSGKVDDQGQPLNPSGSKVAGEAFDVAAERQGHGKLALDRVRPQDATYLAELLGEVFTQDSPKDGTTGESPTSPDTGDSAPS